MSLTSILKRKGCEKEQVGSATDFGFRQASPRSVEIAPLSRLQPSDGLQQQTSAQQIADRVVASYTPGRIQILLPTTCGSTQACCRMTPERSPCLHPESSIYSILVQLLQTITKAPSSKHSLVGRPLAEQLDVALVGNLLDVVRESESHLDVVA